MAWQVRPMNSSASSLRLRSRDAGPDQVQGAEDVNQLDVPHGTHQVEKSNGLSCGSHRDVMLGPQLRTLRRKTQMPFVDRLVDWADRCPDRAAVVIDGQRLSHAELCRRAVDPR